MDQKLQLLLLLFLSPALVMAVEQSQDFLGLKALDCENLPPNWSGSDPCGTNWEGIDCTKSRVTSITLPSAGLKGRLSGDLEQLSELQTLDLSYNKQLIGPLPESIGNLKKLSNLILVGCGFSGQIPGSIGSLQELVLLSLNSNQFIGLIPPSVGNLSNLYWLDLADNLIEGPIPVSDEKSPGLDMLLHCKHFHLGKNKLTGPIPEQLFNSNMKLIHVLFDSNNLTGSIPSTLGLVQSLEVLRLDGNTLTDDVPTNLNNLTKLTELYLSNNKLSGPLPNLTSLNSLTYLDMSNNSFEKSDFPSWPLTLQSLTTLAMERTGLQGKIPVDLFKLPNLETVVLKNNFLNETLEIGPSHSSRLRLVDLTKNSITDFKDEVPIAEVDVVLVGNPYCMETGRTGSPCSISSDNSSYVTANNNCSPDRCSPNLISSPNCKCAFPYEGILYFRAPSFSDLDNTTRYKELENNLMTFFQSYKDSVDSVSLSTPYKNPSGYLQITLKLFPRNRDYFSRAEVYFIGFAFSNQTYKPPKEFGPYVFINQGYGSYADTGNNVPAQSNKSSKSSLGIIVGAAAGGSALVLLLLLAGVYAIRQKRRAERATEQSNPFVRWDTTNKSSGGAPQLKGAKWFSFEELKEYTNNFSAANNVGSGGYGKVYRGTLPTGQLIAIKRAQRESMQGGLEFKNEIELLSRVHHKNLVSLVGFCFEKGEQILVYEYIPNGSLKDSLTGKSGIRLDWTKRLRVALGTARGLAYLHELADPPIIHRDIKSTNVLLDDRLNAKVGDFGLSKLMGNGEKDHVTTQVKGTMGYLDPEYYMTQQLTEKSDVYSFGVLMLEILTARKPIEHGKYVVREIRIAMDKTKDLYNLHELLDQTIGLGTRLKGFERFVDLAMRCVDDAGTDRPTMNEVVKEIETIMQQAGLNPKADSASTSASYEEANKQTPSHPYNDETFDHSGSFPLSTVEPH